MAKFLTKLEEAFVDEYFVDYSITNAYIRAGYKTDNSKRSSINKMAYAVFNKPKIQEAIKERLKTVRQNKDVIMQKLINKAIQIMDDPESKPADVLKAMEYLGKLYGVADNVNVKTEGDLQINFNIEPV